MTKIFQSIQTHFDMVASIMDMEEVRIMAASYFKYEPYLALLAADKKWKVRLVVAENDATSLEVLEYLAKRDGSIKVRQAAKENMAARSK